MQKSSDTKFKNLDPNYWYIILYSNAGENSNYSKYLAYSCWFNETKEIQQSVNS